MLCESHFCTLSLLVSCCISTGAFVMHARVCLTWSARCLHACRLPTNPHTQLLPYPNYYALPQDIAFLAQNGVTGIMNEAQYTGPGGDFIEHNGAPPTLNSVHSCVHA